MEVNGEIHASGALSPKEEPLASVVYEAVWAAEPF
jgi:hypothetical protein